MTARENIAAKVRALQARTIDRGCTEAEAMTAAGLAAKLMTEHDLSMTDVEIGEERCGMEYIDTGRRAAHEVQFCLTALARFTDTKCWKTNRDGSQRFVFFGLGTDTDFAAYLYHLIKTAMDSELAGYKARCREMGEPTGRRESHSFLLGMATRISVRLDAMKRAQSADTIASTGRDLVVVKSAIVVKQFAELNMHLRTTSGRSTIGSRNGYAAGKAAGNRVGLNRPVGNSAGGYLLT